MVGKIGRTALERENGCPRSAGLPHYTVTKMTLPPLRSRLLPSFQASGQARQG